MKVTSLCAAAACLLALLSPTPSDAKRISNNVRGASKHPGFGHLFLASVNPPEFTVDSEGTTSTSATTSTVVESNAITPAGLASMYTLYKDSYLGAGQDLWFKDESGAELLRYPCSVMTLENDSGAIKAYIMFQLRSKVNKISLLAHDGSPEGKKMVMDKVAALVGTPGWVIEAADAVSWVLRSKYNANVITDPNMVASLLDFAGETPAEGSGKNPEWAEANEAWTYRNKAEQSYVHHYIANDRGGVHYKTKETLFGVGGCAGYTTRQHYLQDSTASQCRRVCTPDVAGMQASEAAE